ncbi:MAG: 50S ribosomal protein L28 [Candidatus Buchananbacteria bacterium]|nr:50S ribosomal protein L28 [Candidatus Buchananbacteria bacterium]
MAMCYLCKREPLKGNNVSHSNIKTIRRQKLNLQSRKIGAVRRLICTRCIKTLAKQKTK